MAVVSLSLSLSLVSHTKMVREQLFTLQKENKDFPIAGVGEKRKRKSREKIPAIKLLVHTPK